MEQDIMNLQIKQRIQKQLKLHKMSIRQLSIELETAYSTSYEMVKGSSRISIRSLERIATVLEIDVNILLTSQDDLSGSPGEQKKI